MVYINIDFLTIMFTKKSNKNRLSPILKTFKQVNRQVKKSIFTPTITAVRSHWMVRGQLTFRPLSVSEQISMLKYYDIYCISEVINIPSISIYVNDELYKYLLDKGPSPAVAGKNIIEADYDNHTETENATK